MKNNILHSAKTLICITAMMLLNIMAEAQAITLEPFASGFENPVDISHAGDDRLFIVEKSGTIQILDAEGNRNSEPFIDLDPIVNSGANERGLLGLAFHPDFQDNGLFYVNYTRNGDGATVISEFNLIDADTGDPDSERILLTVDQPFNNHNGGCIQFGPDEFLYIALGDGGFAGDPMNLSQNQQELLGKMLRIDVNDSLTYAIPEDNPFADDDFTLDEIWAIGLRNPWRFSFDSVTGDLWIADVGQNRNEEINFQAAASTGGENYGWRCYEGNDTFETDSNCGEAESFIFPVYEYRNNQNLLGCSVTGGFVYRGETYPSLQGSYIFTDFCSGQFFITRQTDTGFETTLDMVGNRFAYTTFGENSEGELFLADASTGSIQQIQGLLTSTSEPEDRRKLSHNNPVQDILLIESKNIDGPVQARIHNAQGILVMEASLESGNRSIDIQHLHAGQYVLQMEYENTFSTSRFVKL